MLALKQITTKKKIPFADLDCPPLRLPPPTPRENSDRDVILIVEFSLTQKEQPIFHIKVAMVITLSLASPSSPYSECSCSLDRSKNNKRKLASKLLRRNL